ncbi:AVAST type 1 anti-phage system MBL fold metallo-hydrolase Avs1a [Pseudoduganella sp. UC29_71]|uniref:AVAST type 1 anti-phage system MBL fold metallo-hydrolase Avs1a n=1 Tax=Pseudoduganella sp. UC29_71 TaxID=3350174 RepID=UPI00366DA218
MPQLKMFAASYGDAFLLRDEDPDGFAVLIDGGFASTFQNELRTELIAMARKGRSLDLVIATHIDADHISGLIKFFEQNGPSGTPKIIKVEQVWHNSLRSIPSPSIRTKRNLSTDDDQLIDDICKRGFALSNGSLRPDEEIGARQGSSLAALLLKGGYSWNGSAGHHAINSNASDFALRSNARVSVPAPKPERLSALREQWITELRGLGLIGNVLEGEKYDDAFEFLSAADKASMRTTLTETGHSRSADNSLKEAYVPDDSLNNGSSIAVGIETSTSNILFLGDSWAEDIEEAIEKRAPTALPQVFDAIKISHHGSMRNTSCKLLGMIDSPIYLISTNGAKHNHPDLPLLREIVDRPCSFVRHLHFSYSTPESRQIANYRSRAGAAFVVHENSNGWIDIGIT